MSTPAPEHLKAMLDARDKHVREQWIKVMELRLVREELVKCQRSEGINALAQCKELSERYLDMLKTAKVEGWRIVDTAQFKSS